jgi:hypothetical protein
MLLFIFSLPTHFPMLSSPVSFYLRVHEHSINVCRQWGKSEWQIEPSAEINFKKHSGPKKSTSSSPPSCKAINPLIGMLRGNAKQQKVLWVFTKGISHISTYHQAHI